MKIVTLPTAKPDFQLTLTYEEAMALKNFLREHEPTADEWPITLELLRTLKLVMENYHVT
jgi:hypothetical protein